MDYGSRDSLVGKSIKNWNDLMKVFMNTWDVKIDVKLLLNALFEIKQMKMKL